ncbi:MAG: hypothetical protein O3B37_14795 [Proteobacteria bacterium]|nr:hypothetical protein [Pseudomonadota bacterium]
MEVVANFITNPEHQILFILPLVVMTIATLALKPMLPTEKVARKTGRLAAYSDMHREAYIGAIVASVVTIGVFMLRGGPEPFVLVWKPLLSTIMILPFGYGFALAIASVTGMTRRA